MAELTAFMTSNGVPLIAPTDPPEIQIIRSDTQVVVQAFTAMADQGNGMWSFTFAPSVVLDYTFTVDGDPNVTGQVTTPERFRGGSFSGTIDLVGNLLNLDVAVSTRNAVTPNTVVPLPAATDLSEHDATQAALILMNDLLESDQVFDETAGLLHYYRRGTTTDLIPAKTVVTTQTQDTSLTE